MTLTMADTITAANLPGGYSAYAGYTDGEWPSYAAIKARFPDAHLLSITVTAAGPVADACDCERFDLTSAQAIAWAKGRIAAGAWRPVIYCSASLMKSDILPDLGAAGISRQSVRLWSAHYGAGQHICAPGTCGQVPAAMDGTQWTDSAPGENGTKIDASVLADSFFEEETMIVLPGVPGEWLTVSQHFSSNGTQYVTGVGTNGLVYMTKRLPGQAWSSPVAL